MNKYLLSLLSLLSMLMVCFNASATEEGALNGTFTINGSGDKVQFSQGNLQYQASTNTWRFAENQWDIIGAANSNISSTYSGWIDLFGWATSGWESGCGNSAYQPYSTSTNPSDFSLHDLWFVYNMTGDYANADWGVYNAISNGGNAAGLWRTLNFNELNYLFNTRKNASNLRSQVAVNGVCGYAILPDEFILPEGISFIAMAEDWTTNVYDTTAWRQMEAIGAVFLPAAGCRVNENKINFINERGYYWTSSVHNGVLKSILFIHGANSTLLYYSQAHIGLSVRLVKTHIPDTNPTAIENTLAGQTQAATQKILRDGQILIIRGEKEYTLTGQEVR